MIFRKANPEDIDSINYCIRESYSKYISRIGKKPAALSVDFLPLIEEEAVRVIDVDGEIIGLVVLVNDTDFVEIRSLAILPGHQKSGYGKALMKYAEEYALRLGHNTIRLYTNEALPELIEYYEKLNFTEEKRVSEKGFNRVYMIKVLS